MTAPESGKPASVKTAGEAPTKAAKAASVAVDAPVADQAPEPARTTAMEVDPRLLVDEQGARGYLTAFVRRVRSGDLGSLPVVIGLIVIWGVFQSKNSNYLTSFNITTTIAQQMVATGTISLGIVLVLLLGEVDLSAGSVSGVTSAVLVVLNVNDGWAVAPAIIASILVGAGIGMVHGYFFAKVGVPAFVVTLAGLIAWQGLQLYVLGTQGTVNLTTGFVRNLSLHFLSPAVGWSMVVVVVALYAAAQAFEFRSRTRAGLRPRPVIEIVARLVLVGGVLAVSVVVFDRYNGFPISTLIFLVLVVVFDLVIRRTRYGRHILAVGGNIEAARRAGINVAFIRITVFMLASSMAAVGGLLAASQLGSVNQASGGSDLLLNAIAAAVIGGTSLFGGRGSAYSALLGVLVIQSISSGITLLGLQNSSRFMITGAVTLAAVTLDAVSRKGQRANGRV
jgi:D-xylose transport system permease protein